MGNNMTLYNAFRTCPPEAQKPITGGRLKGMTDINPMWRIKALTEKFGPCGFGWIYTIVRTWIEEGAAEERTANVEIALRYKQDGEWSEPIPGIGGSLLVENEFKGLHTCDECYKKALTDAISVACKALGVAADIYFSRDPDSKYPTGDPSGDTFPFAPVHAAQLELTYEAALALVMPAGKYPGMTLAQIYKTDIEYINELGRSPDTDFKIASAISIINAKVKEFQVSKKAGG